MERQVGAREFQVEVKEDQNGQVERSYLWFITAARHSQGHHHLDASSDQVHTCRFILHPQNFDFIVT